MFSLTERISVNSEPISEADLDSLAATHADNLRAANSQAGGALSHFEAVTGLALRHFANQKAGCRSGRHSYLPASRLVCLSPDVSLTRLDHNQRPWCSLLRVLGSVNYMLLHTGCIVSYPPLAIIYEPLHIEWAVYEGVFLCNAGGSGRS